MPRKTKDLDVAEKSKATKKKATKKATKKITKKVAKKVSKEQTKKPTKVKAKPTKVEKKVANKITKSKKTTTPKTTKTTSKTSKKINLPKKTSGKSKTTTGKPKKSITPKKGTSEKKAGLKKTNVKKKTSVRKTSVKKTKKVEVIEYYDLPYRYNQTIVKILAQTPNTLFVYWDISDADRKKYIDKFGENFFNETYPVLIVHNKDMNYSFEIEINDFANSWYFNVADAKCNYEIELGRRAKKSQAEVSLPNNYEYITSSNTIEAPNNHILFEKNQNILFFRNVKTNALSKKDMSSFEFMKYIGQIYNIYSIYQKIYKYDELQDLKNNPSSGFKIM